MVLSVIRCVILCQSVSVSRYRNYRDAVGRILRDLSIVNKVNAYIERVQDKQYVINKDELQKSI